MFNADVELYAAAFRVEVLMWCYFLLLISNKCLFQGNTFFVNIFPATYKLLKVIGLLYWKISYAYVL